MMMGPEVKYLSQSHITKGGKMFQPDTDAISKVPHHLSLMIFKQRSDYTSWSHADIQIEKKTGLYLSAILTFMFNRSLITGKCLSVPIPAIASTGNLNKREYLISSDQLYIPTTSLSIKSWKQTHL